MHKIVSDNLLALSELIVSTSESSLPITVKLNYYNIF